MSGGRDLEVADNRVMALNEVGMVAAHGATDVTIAGNEFRNQLLQAVAIRDGEWPPAWVAGNSIRRRGTPEVARGTPTPR